ncbi:MAG: hypothetical protein K6E19_04075 [Lachnospiraceae bacterium]|nr:hypothetical protein [Lachnospiraceae bacterium]
MPKFKGLKGILILLVLAVMLVFYFYHLSNKVQKTGDEEADNKITAVQTALQRNLTTNYPATPKEVVKYFGEITQCYYNEELTDEDIEALARQMLLLYDDELVSYKTWADYIFDLKGDIAFYNTNGYKISNFTPGASTDVFYFSEDGYEWARMYCVFTIKSGKQFKNINEVFVLRKDEKSHWRIFGWKEVDDKQTDTGN